MTLHDLSQSIPTASWSLLQEYKKLIQRKVAESEFPHLEALLLANKITLREINLSLLELLAKQSRGGDSFALETAERCFTDGRFTDSDRAVFNSYMAGGVQ